MTRSVLVIIVVLVLAACAPRLGPVGSGIPTNRPANDTPVSIESPPTGSLETWILDESGNPIPATSPSD